MELVVMRRGAFCLFQFFFLFQMVVKYQIGRNAPRRILSISIENANWYFEYRKLRRNAPRRILSISIKTRKTVYQPVGNVVMRRGAFCLFQ